MCCFLLAAPALHCVAAPVFACTLRETCAHLSATVTWRCRSFAEQRAAALGETLDGLVNAELEGLGSDAGARRRWRELRQVPAKAEAAGGGSAPDSGAALQALAKLDPKSTGALRSRACHCLVLMVVKDAFHLFFLPSLLGLLNLEDSCLFQHARPTQIDSHPAGLLADDCFPGLPAPLQCP
jgi:hypothetical protein